MSLYSVRSLIACGALVAAFAVPVETQACCFGHSQTTFRPWWGSYTPVAQPVPVAVAPIAAPAPCCAPCQTCCQPQTCCFAPQTSFRPTIESVPVTTFMPVTSTNPCTGCPVTVMKPVTTFVQQTRMVPVTTFSPVVTTAPTCSTCGTATTAFFAPPASTCSTCNSGATTAFFTQPAAPAAPVIVTPAQPTPAAAPTLQGTSIPSPASVGRTFTPEASPTTAPTLKAIIPAAEDKKEEPAPQLLDPNNKTAAAMPIQRGRGYIPVGRPARWESEIDDTAPATPAAPTVDEDGWRAASH